MKLSIAERLQFGLLLPDQGNFIEMTLKKSILDKVQINQEDIKKYDLKTEDGKTFSWDEKKAEDKEVEFTEAELELIKKKLKQLDEQKQIDDVTFEFYKKFIS